MYMFFKKVINKIEKFFSKNNKKKEILHEVKKEEYIPKIKQFKKVKFKLFSFNYMKT